MIRKRTETAAKPRLATRLVDFGLTLLAIGGSICLVLVVLGIALNISIMMFRTGSMSPTITAGSIAFVKEIPAGEIAVGDIVTVQQKESELPVTHRVIEIQEIRDDGVAVFRMQGDANDTADVQPYSVPTVKRVFISVPGIAPVIQWFTSPYLLGGLTLGAAGLVVWAFWPRDEGAEDAETRVLKPQQGGVQSLAVPLLLFASVTAFMPSEVSGEQSVRIAGQHLQMESLPSAEMKKMSPGSSASWVVDIWSEAPDDGTIELSIMSGPDQSDAMLPLTLAVTNCAVQPELSLASGCPDGSPWETKHFKAADFNAGKERKIVAFSASAKQRVVITGHLATNSAKAVQDASASIWLSASGAGETISTSPDDTPDIPSPPEEENKKLPHTGVENVLLLSVLGLVVITLGTLFARRSKAPGDIDA